jgi:N6-L-threonylcarbamoyladenine synthase
VRVLGLETSCDETSVACVDGDGVRANLVSSQVDLHARFGGVVPELASRAHLTNLLPVLDAALRAAGWTLADVEGIAATAGPGLIGAVLMGLSCGKALAWSLGVPLAGVHHIEGHILANDIETPLALPALVLVVSGGHTETVLVTRVGSYQRLGTTLDDAAGETFDKTAKLMGLPYPGGPAIEHLAREGRAGAVELPRALRQSGNLDFSFSGLKTAVRLKLAALGAAPQRAQLADVARGLQDAVIDTLLDKTRRALAACADPRLCPQPLRGLYLAGGVAANGPLRETMAQLAGERDLVFVPPPLAYCTDNAAMIAWAGRRRLLLCGGDPLDLPAFARAGLVSWAAQTP